MKIALNEKTGAYELQPDEPKAGGEVAEMESSISGTLNRVTSFDIMGMPLGAAVVGGTAALVIDRVLLERIDPTHKYTPWSLLAASLLVGKFGRRYAGDAAKYTALILAYEGVADYISALFDKFMPARTTSTAQTRTATASQVGSPAAGDYYSQAFRR